METNAQNSTAKCVVAVLRRVFGCFWIIVFAGVWRGQSWQGLCSQVLEALRYVEYHTVDNSVINAAEAFQDPVDPVAFPDYHQIVCVMTHHPLLTVVS